MTGMQRQSCQSWRHSVDDSLQPLPGRRFCVKHLGEEAYALEVESQLRSVDDALTRYDDGDEHHPDEAKEFIEPVLRAFFDNELRELGLRCGTGFRRRPDRAKREQLDISLALKYESASAWTADVSARRYGAQDPLAIHMEIAFRKQFSAQKLKADFEKLSRSIENAVQHASGLPWTSLILLGPAWTNAAPRVMSFVHERYHSVELRRVRMREQYWWPYLDAVVLPDVMYKKHELFEEETLQSPSWPAYMGTPVAHDVALRPLAIARAFLMHRVGLLLDKVSADAPAWSTDRSSAIFGPEAESIEHVRGYVPCHLPDALARLWHAGSKPHADASMDGALAWMPMTFHEPPTCSLMRRYSVLPGGVE